MKTPYTPFATRLSGSAKETELRLRSIFQWKKKRPPVVLFVLAALLVLMCCSLVSCRVEEQSPSADVVAPGEESVESMSPGADTGQEEIGAEILADPWFDSYVTEFPFYVYTGMKVSDHNGRVFTIEDTPKNRAEAAVIDCYGLNWTGGTKKLELYCGNGDLRFEPASNYKKYTIHEVSTLTPEDFTVETMPYLDSFLRSLTEDTRKYGLTEYAVVYVNKSWEWTDEALALGPQLGNGRYEWVYLVGKTDPDTGWKLYNVYWGEYVYGRILEDLSLSVLEEMATVKAGDFTNPEYFGNITAEQLAAALNAAVDKQISEAEYLEAIGGRYAGVFPHWYIENAWLEGGSGGHPGTDRNLDITCGLPENIVAVTLSEDNHGVTAYFKDETLYRLVRHKNDYEETVDAVAYARFEGLLVTEMKEILALFAGNPGNFTGYELKLFALVWTYEEEDGCRVELYDFDFALLTDTPETVGWAGGMTLDSNLRVGGVGPGQFAVRYRNDEVVCTTFMGTDFYYLPQDTELADWAKEHIATSLDYAQANPLEQFAFVWHGDPIEFMELTIHLPDSWLGKVGYVRPSPDFIQFYHLPSRQNDTYMGTLFSVSWSLGALALDYEIGNGVVLASTSDASYILTWPSEPQSPTETMEEYSTLSLTDVQIVPSQELLDTSVNRFN